MGKKNKLWKITNFYSGEQSFVFQHIILKKSLKPKLQNFLEPGLAKH